MLNIARGITAQKAYRNAQEGKVSNHGFKIFTSWVNLPHGGGPTTCAQRPST